MSNRPVHLAAINDRATDVAEHSDQVDADPAGRVPLHLLRHLDRACAREGCGHPFTEHQDVPRICEHVDRPGHHCRCAVYLPPDDLLTPGE